MDRCAALDQLEAHLSVLAADCLLAQADEDRPDGRLCRQLPSDPAGHDRQMGRRQRLLPRLPGDGTWFVQHEGFTSGP